MEGYLHKKSTGAVKRWQKRWFCLQNQNLVYYQSKTALEHVKDKEINLLTEVNACRFGQNPRVIVIVKKDQSRIELRAETIDLAEEWQAAILERQEQLGWTRTDVDDAPWVSSDDEDDVLDKQRAAKAEADRKSRTASLMAQIYSPTDSASKRPKSAQVQSSQPPKDAPDRRAKSGMPHKAPRLSFRMPRLSIKGGDRKAEKIERKIEKEEKKREKAVAKAKVQDGFEDKKRILEETLKNPWRFHCGVVYKRVHLHTFETLGSKKWKRYWCAFRRGIMLFYRFPKDGESAPKYNVRALGAQNPAGDQNPFGDSKPSDERGTSSSNPFGDDEPQPSSNPFGDDEPQPSSNPFGHDEPQPSSNPFGDDEPQPSSNPFGASSNPFGDAAAAATNPFGVEGAAAASIAKSTNPVGDDSNKGGSKKATAATKRHLKSELPAVVKYSSKENKCYFVHEKSIQRHASLAFLKNIPAFGFDSKADNSTSPDFSLNLTGIEDFDWIALSDPHDAQCLELRICTSLEQDPVLLRFHDARTAEDWKEKCHFNKKLQMDLLEQNTEKSCLLTLERIQRLSPIAANLISLEDIQLSNEDDAQIPQWMEGQLKWVVSLLVIADDRERTMYIKERVMRIFHARDSGDDSGLGQIARAALLVLEDLLDRASDLTQRWGNVFNMPIRKQLLKGLHRANLRKLLKDFVKIANSFLYETITNAMNGASEQALLGAAQEDLKLLLQFFWCYEEAMEQITAVMEDKDEAHEIVTQFRDECARVIQTFVNECKRRLTLSCRGMTTGSYRLDMFRAEPVGGPVTTEVPQSLLDVLKALVLSAKTDRMPIWLSDMLVVELCKVLLQQQRALTKQFAAQPEETEHEETATRFYAAVANDCCQWASVAMQLLVAAQSLSARTSLHNAVDELVFTTDTVTPNQIDTHLANAKQGALARAQTPATQRMNVAFEEIEGDDPLALSPRRQSMAWEMIDVSAQWLTEIRRTLQCLGWRMLTIARPIEPFDMAIGPKPKRDLESCMKVLLEPVTSIVTGHLFPFALQTALGSTLGMWAAGYYFKEIVRQHGLAQASMFKRFKLTDSILDARLTPAQAAVESIVRCSGFYLTAQAQRQLLDEATANSDSLIHIPVEQLRVAFKLRKQTPILHVQVHQDLNTTIQKQYSADGHTAPQIDELMLGLLPLDTVKECIGRNDSETDVRSLCHDLVSLVRSLRQFIEDHGGDLPRADVDTMTAEFWFGTQSVFSSARRLLANKPEDVESGFCMLVTECRCSPQSALLAMETLTGVNSCLSNRAKKTVLDRCTKRSQQLRATWEQQCPQNSVCSPDVFAWIFR